MTIKMASIPLDNPYHASYQMEGSKGYQYRAVIKGTNENQVKVIAAGGDDCIIAGIIQNDVNEDAYVRTVHFGPTKARAQTNITRDGLLRVHYVDDSEETDEDKKLNGSLKPLGTTNTIVKGKMVVAIALEDAVQYAIFKVFLLRQIGVAIT